MAPSDSSTKKSVSRLTSNILPLLRNVSRLQREMDALGIFTPDRELLECPSCDLAEDVTIEGRLISVHLLSENLTDCGLCFKKIDEDTFSCPICGTKIKATNL